MVSILSTITTGTIACIVNKIAQIMVKPLAAAQTRYNVWGKYKNCSTMLRNLGAIIIAVSCSLMRDPLRLASLYQQAPIRRKAFLSDRWRLPRPASHTDENASQRNLDSSGD